MLINSISAIAPARLRAKQAGVALVLALIMLVALTLAALSLVRSVDTSNIIAGNLAFQQGATQYGDVGTEQAVTWLQNNNIGVTLHGNGIAGSGYSAIHLDNPLAGQTWDAYWTATLATAPAGLVTLAQDPATGNQVSYSIQRLCSQAGDPTVPGQYCAVPPAVPQPCHAPPCVNPSTQVYYRITSRIAGPRNSVSYVQTIVSM